MTETDQLTIRRARAEDLDQIIEVCSAALQWSGDDADADFFRWKHVQNAFGPSPIWVAEEGTGESRAIVGVRAMMLWELCRPGGQIRRMGRAVDTATLPSHQGKGIFSRLTMAAVEEMTSDGFDAIFNTPNDKSRPGYLKMGWQNLGRVPVTVRPRGPRSLLTMARSKVAAERWGLATGVGLDPTEAFADRTRLEKILTTAPESSRWSTRLSVDYLKWRTSFEPLAARVAPLGSDLDDGFMVFRLRRRGALTQLSILDVVRARSSRPLRRIVPELMKETGADVALASGRRLALADGLLPLPSSGPILTWRPLAPSSDATLSDLHLPLGTIELF